MQLLQDECMKCEVLWRSSTAQRNAGGGGNEGQYDGGHAHWLSHPNGALKARVPANRTMTV